MDTSSLDNLKLRFSYNDVVKLPKDQQDFIRRECQTNLRFLANCILRPASKKFLPLSERCHGRIIDNFLRPDPDKSFEDWSPIKEWVTLASRGILKSTIVASFLVQCQLCDPDIRILIVSGKLKLAQTILETARQPFATNDVIRYLFPRFAIDISSLAGDEFTSPARDPSLNLRDPTLSVATFESIKAGGHYEIVLFDDCTNEINCATPELVEKCEQCYDDTDPLVEPGGYRPFFGTRWAPDDADLPEVIRRRGDIYAEEHDGERSTSYLNLPAWMVRSVQDVEEQRRIDERDRRNQLHPEDVILTWPEKLSSKVLWPKYRANPVKFNKQYLLRFAGSLVGASFPRDLLVANTRPFAEGAPLPHDRFVIIRWDLSDIYSGRRPRNASNFSCGMAVMFELSTRRMFCYDAILEVFSTSTDMATTIVDFYESQMQIDKVGICEIEDAHGARMLHGEIERIAKLRKVPIVVTWSLAECKKDQKAMAIAQLAGEMKKGHVQFSTTLSQREEIFRQFEKWSINHQNVKDDGPDNLAQIWKNYSASIFPNLVTTLQSSQVTYDPEPMAEAPPDPHADERENADFRLLESMTVQHS